MKRFSYTRVISILLVLVLSVALFGCTTTGGASLNFGDEDETKNRYVVSVELVGGNIVITYSDGATQNLGASVTHVNNNDIDINLPEGTDNQVVAISRAMLSTVGVQCAFTETYYVVGGGLWPGYTTEDQTVYSYGSGVIYTMDKTEGDAYIVTNYHVVYDSAAKEENGISQDIKVYLRGESETMQATYIGGSPIYDIAVLRVENSAVLRASAAEAVNIRNSDSILVGENAYAVGNPEASGISATAGIVSVDSEYIQMDAVDGTKGVSFRVIRVDTPINSGNSGGGLYDKKGNLIGIVNAKVSSSNVENIGFAIPTNVAIAIAQNIIDYHAIDASNTNVCRALLGITTGIASSSMTYDVETGIAGLSQVVKIDDLTETGLAKAAGLEIGYTLCSIQVGERAVVEINRLHQIIDEMLWAREGNVVTITCLNAAGETIQKSITITADALQMYE